MNTNSHFNVCERKAIGSWSIDESHEADGHGSRIYQGEPQAGTGTLLPIAIFSFSSTSDTLIIELSKLPEDPLDGIVVVLAFFA